MNTRRSLAIVSAVVIAIVGITTVVADSPLSKRAPRLSGKAAHVAKLGSDFGAPLAGLTESQLEEFAEGLEDFEGVDTAASGLGPVFNRDCARPVTPRRRWGQQHDLRDALRPPRKRCV